MDLMNGLKAKYGDRFWLAHLDVTGTPALVRVVDEASAGLGKTGVVVNNAGCGLFGAAGNEVVSAGPRNANFRKPVGVTRFA
jgi:NADP-dependent 3-hydroxy acid dehydrogenase YdfG